MLKATLEGFKDMSNFKFELWDIENGVVITRPIIVDKDEETGQPIFKNSSIYREDPLVAFKEVQVALDAVKADYQRKLAQKR